jgi:hypothetical protein
MRPSERCMPLLSSHSRSTTLLKLGATSPAMGGVRGVDLSGAGAHGLDLLSSTGLTRVPDLR